MLRNLVLSATFLIFTILTGCQSVLHKENSPSENPKIELAKTSDTAKRSQPEPVIPFQPEQKPSVLTHRITIHEQTIQTPTHLDGRLVLGVRESAELPNLNLIMQAKLDTGAESSSVDARNIQFFERDGKKWVKFDLHRTSKGVSTLELPVKGIIKIKRPELSPVDRPVVQMTITIGEITQSVPVSLADRREYEAPLLIGRNFMQDLAVIDVNQKFIATQSLISSTRHEVEAPLSQAAFTRTILKPVSIEGLVTIGAVEHTTLPDFNAVLEARIDTGALTSSLDARNITVLQKDDAEWVRFQLPNARGKPTTITAPVTRFVLIKRHGEKPQRRPVITLNTTIGDITKPTQFTLRNRQNYRYPVLIGARFLQRRALVDVSREFTADSLKLDALTGIIHSKRFSKESTTNKLSKQDR